MDIEPALFAVTGVYNITCDSPVVSPASDLRLFLHSEGYKTWGAFSWGPYSGIILMNPGPTSLSTFSPVSFGWRARDSRTRAKRFGRGCTGFVWFGKGGRISGTFSDLLGEERVDFGGVRRAGPLWCGRSAESFEREWDGFVGEVYGGREG